MKIYVHYGVTYDINFKIRYVYWIICICISYFYDGYIFYLIIRDITRL